MDRRIAREALRLLDSRRPFVRATIVRAVGSVPAKVGASMIVRDDGTTLGTVGGAALEERVKAEAGRALGRRRGDLHHFDLAKWREGGLPSLCGGSVDVALEYVGAPPHLLLWGGGHVAQALANLLPSVEYDYAVADDRPDWIGPDRFPAATGRFAVSAERLWEEVPAAQFSHLFVLGYDAGKDLIVLRSALQRFPGSIGLIASRTKRGHLFQELRRLGASEADVGRIHSPIGLPIGAESPPEIAVSVVAELIQERRRAAGEATSLKDPGGTGEPDGEPTA